MKRLFICVVCMMTLNAFTSTAMAQKEAWLSMAYTNALHNELPFAIFTKDRWSPDPKARFVKLHLYFDDPIWIKGLSINGCGSVLNPRISMFFNFDQFILPGQSDLSGEMPAALYPIQEGDLLVFEGFNKPIEVRSLTINFEANVGFSICGIKVFDPEGQAYRIRTPELVNGEVTASSTLEPKGAYDPIFLFDSRFEYAWASNKQAKDVNLSFTFNQTMKIEKIRLWNGYQRSVTHCLANSRAKKIIITGDNQYRAAVDVSDLLGSQIIQLPKPFTGKQLTLNVIDSFPGKSYKDLVISEVRFYDGKTWFLLDPAPRLEEGIAENLQKFNVAKTATVLNDSYVAKQELKVEPYWITSTLRLRSDGSFYLSGYLGEMESTRYFSLGNYEIKDFSKNNGIRLRLFGLYYETEEYGDCNGCGRDCNINSKPAEQSTQKIFQETITIKPAQNGTFEIENISGGGKLKFKKLNFEREVGR